ncbi:MAG: hypothetical protein WAS50_08155 [Nitrospira sp.]
MRAEINLTDIRSDVIDQEKFEASNGNVLHHFFEFWPAERQFLRTDTLRDCFFVDLHITSYVKKWIAGVQPPAHPGIFAESFSRIVQELARPDQSLTLCVKSLVPEYFDEITIIKDVLLPRKLPFILLSNPTSRADNDQKRDGCGYLFFEWIPADLEYVAENWFLCPQLEVEGYISKQAPWGRLAELFSMPDTEERLRNLLGEIEIGFKVWQDNNGLFLTSRKHDLDAIRRRLDIIELNLFIEQIAARHDATL